ncbi:MAG: hypothetical protein A2499_05095 [Stygiobacter sp. RIFOXYC12_FULL_38_8]|nr:MAG: hypothetical protein A2299_16460 [Stygiobacter sp. RIFOXYB2_FULL_37_11]OGV13500.1 MAG: hypothetical protein A2237_17160 [Stygiobacter sp. RIFOXYA2_FULL_38_8]OGV14792.1 MAG: hypothetical protein A2440_09840 [Stygiobacter sp. RIFOXYC2_FULL_38_25]OGV22326.1 MAG: hypothetical protein A2499_05095 [Stygiobacter sp. RIFOXYC12_FULL_38_8]OGV79285.1 MAG: hypothetical protein A2X65_02210 [Stygiobacter sp. GWF2_38_21]
MHEKCKLIIEDYKQIVFEFCDSKIHGRKEMLALPLDDFFQYLYLMRLQRFNSLIDIYNGLKS